MKETANNATIHRQRGVALAVSMVLLTVITLLSLTAMRGSNLDTKIAVNHQHKQFAFQAAENALARIIVLPPSTNPATQVTSEASQSDWYTKDNITGSANISADLTISYLRQAPCVISGYGIGTIECRYYDVDAFGKVADTNARVHNRMEIALPIPRN